MTPKRLEVVEKLSRAVAGLRVENQALKDGIARPASLLRSQFDRIVKRRTGHATLDRLLKRLFGRKNELLRGLPFCAGALLARRASPRAGLVKEIVHGLRRRRVEAGRFLEVREPRPRDRLGGAEGEEERALAMGRSRGFRRADS